MEPRRKPPDECLPRRIPLAFPGDGAWLAAGGLEARTLQITNLVDGRAWNTQLEAGQRRVDAVAFSPDGKTLATGCQNGTLKLWSLERREELLHLQAHTDGVYALAFSPDGSVLASGSGGQEKVVRLWCTAARPR